MKKLSTDHLLKLHAIVEERFDVLHGVKDPGLLSSIAERPSLQINSFTPYDNVFKQAASLMEGVIRLHPFYDGNKRTGLLAAVCYLELNGYSTAIPFNSVRFTVRIAKAEGVDSEFNKKLINKIAKWLCKHSARPSSRRLRWKQFLYIKSPMMGLLYLAQYGRMQTYVHSTISDWFAFDIYPEYAREVTETLTLIRDLLDNKSVWDLKK